MTTDGAALKTRLWSFAGHFLTNPSFESQQCTAPVLGLVGDIRHGGSISSFGCDQLGASAGFSSKIAYRAAGN